MGAVDDPGQSLLDALCRNLRALREARGLTQADLARAGSITPQHYRLLESGRASAGGLANPRLNTLEALAHALGVNVASLLLGPSLHSVFRRAECYLIPGWDSEEAYQAALLDALAQSCAGAAMARVDGNFVTLGLCCLAADTTSAVVLTGPHFVHALDAAGVSANLLPDYEVSAGRDPRLVEY